MVERRLESQELLVEVFCLSMVVGREIQAFALARVVQG
jgi:hypothetical protein